MPERDSPQTLPMQLDDFCLEVALILRRILGLGDRTDADTPDREDSRSQARKGRMPR